MVIAVFGIGELARTFSAYVPPNFFIVDKEYIPDPAQFLGRSVFELKYLAALSVVPKVYVPVSYKNCNKDRESVFNRVNDACFTVSSYTHPTAYVNDTAEVGEGCVILPLTNIDPNVKLGRGVCAWAQSHFGHSSVIGDFVWVTTGAVICGQVEIGDRTFVGANAIIHPSVKVGSDCIIGSGAIITKDLASFSVALEGRDNIISRKSYEVNL